MANVFCPNFRGDATLRATRLDACGEPLFEECAFAVSDGWIEATIEPDETDGDAFLAKNAGGRALVNEKSDPLLNWYNVAITFQTQDWELWNILTNQPIYEDCNGLAAGMMIRQDIYGTGNVALEFWSNVTEQECLPGESLPFYGYHLLPWVKNGRQAEVVTLTNDLITISFAGRTRRGTPWGVGPYDVVLDSADQPSPLCEPIPSDTHYMPITTQLAPPTPMCGCQTLTS